MKSQDKHNLAIKICSWIVIEMWFLLQVFVSSPFWCWIFSVSRKNMWVKASSSPLLSSDLILLFLKFFFCEPCIHTPMQDWLAGTYISSCREGHLHNCLAQSADTVNYLKERPLSGPLCSSCAPVGPPWGPWRVPALEKHWGRFRL